MPKPLTVWITINCGKFWKRWAYQTTWPASWEIVMQVRKQQFLTCMVSWVLGSMWSQRIGHGWATELNWTQLKVIINEMHNVKWNFLMYSVIGKPNYKHPLFSRNSFLLKQILSQRIWNTQYFVPLTVKSYVALLCISCSYYYHYYYTVYLSLPRYQVDSKGSYHKTCTYVVQESCLHSLSTLVSASCPFLSCVTMPTFHKIEDSDSKIIFNIMWSYFKRNLNAKNGLNDWKIKAL